MARNQAEFRLTCVVADAPDFLLLWKGRSIGLELKETGGRQSDSQRDTERDWLAAGGVYRCCKGYDEAVAFLDVLGVLRPDRSLVRRQQEGEAA